MMKKIAFLSLGAMLLASCDSTQAQATRPQGGGQLGGGAANRTQANIDYAGLGKRIWANECAGSVHGLVSWNAGEDFPSLGIGHFIWYPAGVQGPFDESLPRFVAFARHHGVQVPALFNGKAPWPNKAAFLADKSGRADQMRQWLAQNVELQTRFIVARMQASRNKMAQGSRNPQLVATRFDALCKSTKGVYCLVDYVNFKGEGLKESERYQGQGWGLLQVLEEMRDNSTAEFSRAAGVVLSRRVKNAPPARNENRWLPGWLNRCKTYQ